MAGRGGGEGRVSIVLTAWNQNGAAQGCPTGCPARVDSAQIWAARRGNAVWKRGRESGVRAVASVRVP